MEYSKPDFLIVGAAKSGTTSLYNYLSKHPKIHIPDVKECRFFSQLQKNFVGLGAEFFVNEGITDEETYFSLFDENKVCGDISNDYLYYHKQSIRNIKKYLASDIKIIIILRNPIDRAYSNYMHHVRDGWENKTFEEALLSENQRIRDNWSWSYHYFNTGLYYNQVKSYLDNFKNVKILIYEDLKEQKIIDEILQFLNLTSIDYTFSKEKQNISGVPKSILVNKILNNKRLSIIISKLLKQLIDKKSRQQLLNFRLKLLNANLKQIKMKASTRQNLSNKFSHDINKLSVLIDRDLSNWLN